MIEQPPLIAAEAAAIPRAVPVGPNERLESLDVMRGFALLGILLVNMALFGWPMQKVLLGAQEWASQWDAAVDWLVRVFAEGKFYPLFAFLFGIGFALQMDRAEAGSGRWMGLFCRRLLVLLCFGLAHAFLVWEGDILLVYAVLGFLLLPFRRRKPLTLVVWAAVCLQIPIAIYVALWGLLSAGTFAPEIAATMEQEMSATNEGYAEAVQENLEVFASGTWLEIFARRASNVGFMWSYIWIFGPIFLAMFLVGLCAARMRVIQEPEAHPTLIRRTMVWGFIIGLPANVFYGFSSVWGDPMMLDRIWVAGAAIFTLGGPALTFAYVATLLRLLQQERWQRRLRPLAAAGRMALSNYLFQSLVCTTIFYSYGLGLYGTVGRAAGVALALVIYAVQVPLSMWWLRRFRFGPAEWLWRTLTYGQLQPMRR